MFRWLPIVILCLATTLPLSAGLKKLNYGQRSKIEDQKAEGFEVKQPEMNTQFGGTRMDLTEWHTQFSTLGQKKSDLVSGSDRFSGDRMDFDVQEKKLKNTEMAPGNRKMGQVRNWNYAMENLMANKFQGGEITSPAGRQMQQFIDEVNLREVNRFMFERNKTEEGLPVQRAGEGELEDIPMQLRDNGGIRTVSPDDEDGDPGQLFRNPFQRNGSESDATE